jgi:hypothetical protein
MPVLAMANDAPHRPGMPSMPLDSPLTPDQLFARLGVAPGSVTRFLLANDTAHRVAVVLDKGMLDTTRSITTRSSTTAPPRPRPAICCNLSRLAAAVPASLIWRLRRQTANHPIVMANAGTQSRAVLGNPIAIASRRVAEVNPGAAYAPSWGFSQ